MAEFKRIENNNFNGYDEVYKINGKITLEDVKKINSFSFKTLLILDNTKEQESAILNHIKSDYVNFSVVGGFDYFNKNKYKEQKYINRTIITPTALCEVIKYFEEIEQYISSDWTDVQKCMFLYSCIVKDFTYDENYETPLSKGVMETTLAGTLYKKLVCAGFAQVFKEGLDRLGIKNYYQNKKNRHDWNVVELDGKLRGMEITWECSNKKQPNSCRFAYFGQDPKFYDDDHHKFYQVIEGIDELEESEIIYDSEEQIFELKPFTVSELQSNLEVIYPAILERSKHKNKIYSDSELKELFTYDRLTPKMEKIASDYKEESNYIKLYNFLIKNGVDVFDFSNVVNKRKGVISDVVEIDYKFTGADIGIDSLADLEFDNYFDYRIKELNLDKEQVLKMLSSRLFTYYSKFLIETISEVDILIQEYDRLQENSVSDIQYAFDKANIYSKLQGILSSKDLVIKMGVSENKINDVCNKIDECFKKHEFNEVELKEIKRENDKDFLYAMLNDIDELKLLAEQKNGRKYTYDEWVENYKSSQFIRETFSEFISEYDVSDEELQLILNDIVLENSKRK